jgi:HK97 family phage major capsid protein
VTLEEILARQRAIRADLKAMADNPEVTEEDDADIRDTLVAEYELLEKRAEPIVARMEKLKLIAEAGAKAENREAGGGGGGGGLALRTDPFANLQAVRNHLVPRHEMISRALDGVETMNKRGWLPHDGAEEATRKAQHNPAIARQMLLTGSEEYLEAFRHYLQNPNDRDHASRALVLGTGSLGYMLPFVLDPTIILSNTGSANPWRRMARVETTTSNTWNGVTSAGVNAAFLAEGVQGTDASPSVGQLQITPQKAAAWVFGSFEAIDDSNFGEQLPTLFADARDRLEAAAFCTGNGTTQPQGVLTALGTASYAGSGFAAATGAPAQTLVYNLLAALAPRWRNSPKMGWAANIKYLNQLRSIDQQGGNAWWANWTQGQPGNLMGYPIFEASAMTSSAATAATASTGSAAVLAGDFSEYVIVDRVYSLAA